tara:strand:+ start:394 stop:672 length:279 start_codon:yes stop_codon:yes gene_type:complete
MATTLTNGASSLIGWTFLVRLATWHKGIRQRVVVVGHRRDGDGDDQWLIQPAEHAGDGETWVGTNVFDIQQIAACVLEGAAERHEGSYEVLR